MMNAEYKYVWESRRGIYRVVIDTPVYSKETKRTTHHYETVGKAKEKGGPIDFGHMYKAVQKAQGETVPAKSVTLVGEKLVLDRMSSTSGLRRTLVKSFGKDRAETIFNLACYLICTGDALANSPAWHEERGLRVLDAPGISELLPLLNEESCSVFFRNWTALHARNRTLCYDITGVSTYAKDMTMDEFGCNRDHEKWFRQINLAMLTDEESHLPLAFRMVNGPLGDVQTLKDTIRDLAMYGATPNGMVMDRGSWNAEKLQMLTDAGIKYMIPVPGSVGWARKLVSDFRSEVFNSTPLKEDDGSYTFACTVYDPLKTGKRIWAHVLYSPAMEAEHKQRFVDKYMTCRKELQDGTPDERHQDFYDEYFTISTRGRGGKPHVQERTPLADILKEMTPGYWVLYTDLEKDAFTALGDYRDRNFIEAGFDDLKGSADAGRLGVRYDRSVYGRMFIQFCSQVLRTQLRAGIAGFDHETRKYAASPDELLRTVRMYSQVSYKGRYRSQFTTLTKGQGLIFKALGISAEGPDSEDGQTGDLFS